MSAHRKPFRVLFICMGNICRSPAAEIVFRELVEDAGLAGEIHIDSAGTIGYHAGKGPDPRMAATLKSRGYTIAGRSRQVRPDDLEDFDLLLVPAGLFGIALLGRFVGLATDGAWDRFWMPMLVEATCVIVLLIASRVLPHPQT